VFGRKFRSGLLVFRPPARVRLRGCHPLRLPVPRDFACTRCGVDDGATSSLPFGGYSARSVPVSVALTPGIAVAFFSCPYYNALLQGVPVPGPVLRSPPGVRPCGFRSGAWNGRVTGTPRLTRGTKSHSETPGSRIACVFPGRIAACRVLRRCQGRVIPLSAYAYRTLRMPE